MGYTGRAGQPAASQFVYDGPTFTGKSLAADDYHFAWPIPAREIKVNANLTQNPGY